jgi:hypothetical protein
VLKIFQIYLLFLIIIWNKIVFVECSPLDKAWLGQPAHYPSPAHTPPPHPTYKTPSLPPSCNRTPTISSLPQPQRATHSSLPPRRPLLCLPSAARASLPTPLPPLRRESLAAPSSPLCSTLTSWLGAVRGGGGCDNPIRDNSVLSPKPLHLVIKR